MSTPLTRCVVSSGHTEGRAYGPTGHPVDWCTFHGRYSSLEKPMFNRPPTVFVTAVIEDQNGQDASPVCVVQETTTTDLLWRLAMHHRKALQE